MLEPTPSIAGNDVPGIGLGHAEIAGKLDRARALTVASTHFKYLFLGCLAISGATLLGAINAVLALVSQKKVLLADAGRVVARMKNVGLRRVNTVVDEVSQPRGKAYSSPNIGDSPVCAFYPRSGPLPAPGGGFRTDLIHEPTDIVFSQIGQYCVSVGRHTVLMLT